MLSRYILLSLFVVFTFSGCGGSSVTPTAKVIPEWITSTLPADNEKYLYGMAIESNRESAIKAALSDMIAKLGTTIESSYESSEIVKGSYSESIIKNEIKSNVSKIKINNYRVIKSYKVSYREFAVMIQTDRQKLIKGLQENLELSKRDIVQRSDFIKDSDILTRYNVKKELWDETDKLLSEVLVISELDKSFNKELNLDFIVQIQDDFLVESKKLKFFVSGDDKSDRFVDIIKNNLAQYGFNITSQEKDAVQIKIKTTDYISRSNSIDIAVLSLKVDLFDKLKRIGGRSIVLKEIYSGSMATVYKNASIHLKQDIDAKSINEVIGINIKMD